MTIDISVISESFPSQARRWFYWVGRTRFDFAFGPAESAEVHISAAFVRTGVFVVNRRMRLSGRFGGMIGQSEKDMQSLHVPRWSVTIFDAVR